MLFCYAARQLCLKSTVVLNCMLLLYFFELYAFIILTSTLVLGINYFVVITHPRHQLQVRKRRCAVVI